MTNKLKIKEAEKPDNFPCEHDSKFMVDLLAGEISDKDRSFLATQLDNCDVCRDQLNELSVTWKLTSEVLKGEFSLTEDNTTETATLAPEPKKTAKKAKKADKKEESSKRENLKKKFAFIKTKIDEKIKNRPNFKFAFGEIAASFIVVCMAGILYAGYKMVGSDQTQDFPDFAISPTKDVGGDYTVNSMGYLEGVSKELNASIKKKGKKGGSDGLDYEKSEVRKEKPGSGNSSISDYFSSLFSSEKDEARPASETEVYDAKEAKTDLSFESSDMPTNTGSVSEKKAKKLPSRYDGEVEYADRDSFLTTHDGSRPTGGRKKADENDGRGLRTSRTLKKNQLAKPKPNRNNVDKLLERQNNIPAPVIATTIPGKGSGAKDKDFGGKGGGGVYAPADAEGGERIAEIEWKFKSPVMSKTVHDLSNIKLAEKGLKDAKLATNENIGWYKEEEKRRAPSADPKTAPRKNKDRKRRLEHMKRETLSMKNQRGPKTLKLKGITEKEANFELDDAEPEQEEMIDKQEEMILDEVSKDFDDDKMDIELPREQKQVQKSKKDSITTFTSSTVPFNKELYRWMGGSNKELQTYFKNNGVQYSYASSGRNGKSQVKYSQDGKSLTIIDTRENIAKIEKIIAQTRHTLENMNDRTNGLPFTVTKQKPVSTFSIDVDTASYTRCAKDIREGKRPSSNSVRPEEFVNYFDYHYRSPAKRMFGVYLEAAPSPFRPLNTTLRIGVQGKRLGSDLKRPSAFTIVIDTSGSMASKNRLDLVKRSLPIMLSKLRNTDKVSIIACGSETVNILPLTAVKNKKKIIKTVKDIEPEGVTDLEKGIVQAYKTAAKHYVAGAYNRVILFTDGISNISTASAEEILEKVDSSRKMGISNTVVSVGGDGDDTFLETLANKGDGNYVFIEDDESAKDLFENQFAARFREIARDVKIQVEFSDTFVNKYRQVGYQNRQLSKADFRNDSVDAGEVGAGQSVTALYEMQLNNDLIIPMAKKAHPDIYPPPHVAIVRIRYKRADTMQVEEFEYPLYYHNIKRRSQKLSPNFELACSVAEFAENLRFPDTAGIANLNIIRKKLRPLLAGTYKNDTKVKELDEIVRLAK